MPSALRSAGGSVDSSTPGGAIGDPESATSSCVPSRENRRPRGRFPTAMVCSISPAAGSMTAMVPAVSFETKMRAAAGVTAGGGCCCSGAGARLHAATRPPARAAMIAGRAEARALFMERECIERVASGHEEVLPAVEDEGRSARSTRCRCASATAACRTRHHRRRGCRRRRRRTPAFPPSRAARRRRRRSRRRDNGRRHATLPVFGSIAVRKLPARPDADLFPAAETHRSARVGSVR